MHGFSKLSFHEMQGRWQGNLGARPDVHWFAWIMREGPEQRTAKVGVDTSILWRSITSSQDTRQHHAGDSKQK